MLFQLHVLVLLLCGMLIVIYVKHAISVACACFIVMWYVDCYLSQACYFSYMCLFYCYVVC